MSCSAVMFCSTRCKAYARFIFKAGLILIALLVGVGCSPRVSLEEAIERGRALEELLTQAVLAMRLEDPEALDRAEAALKLAFELSPEDPRVLDGLGCVAWRRGRPVSARRWFERAIRSNPSYGRAYGHLALVLEKEGDPQRAYSLFKKAIELAPLDFRTRGNYAVFLKEYAMDGEAALSETLKALQSSPGRRDELLLHNEEVLRELNSSR